jgi:type I restriction enzyme S subunit
MIHSDLGKISKILKTGKTPPSKNEKYFENDYNWFTPGDISNTKYINSSVRHISELAVKDGKASLYPKKSLLITCIGNIGRVGISQDSCASNQQITAITPTDEVDVEYLYYWFIKNQQLLENVSNSAVVPILNNRSLKNIPFNYPPLKTQQRIAGILDDAAALRDKTAQLLTEYDLLAQSIFLEMFGDPVINEKGWVEQSLKKITSKIGSGSTPRGGKESYHEVGISLIRSLNIHDNLFKTKNLAFIDFSQAEKLKNVTIAKNDVLINITGASVARCAIVPDNILPARVNQHVSILRCKKDIINPVFLLHLIISENCKVKLLGVGSSNAATRESITKEQLETFEVIIPPIEFQNEFADKIALIEQQKALAKKELQESEDLFNCLLQQAFKGELV